MPIGAARGQQLFARVVMISTKLREYNTEHLNEALVLKALGLTCMYCMITLPHLGQALQAMEAILENNKSLFDAALPEAHPDSKGWLS